MKSAIVVVLLLASLGANGFLWRRLNALDHEGERYPISEKMGHMQRYADKLWYAGEAGNWDLAKFYRDAIVEVADDLAAAHIVNEDGEVSRQLNLMLPPTLGEIDQAVAARDAAAFRAKYQNLVTACNACHQQTKHAFLQFKIPSGPPVHWNQQFPTP